MMDLELGPLARFEGEWEGERGESCAPTEEAGIEHNRYKELMAFEPLGLVKYHQQKVYGLRYRTKAWELGHELPFHEEVGYWLWVPKTQRVVRCFVTPHGIATIAGSAVSVDVNRFELSSELGSDTYGICSNQFLNEKFQTVRYDLKIIFHNDESFSYEEESVLKIKGQEELFHHTHKNSLNKFKFKSVDI